MRLTNTEVCSLKSKFEPQWLHICYRTLQTSIFFFFFDQASPLSCGSYCFFEQAV